MPASQGGNLQGQPASRTPDQEIPVNAKNSTLSVARAAAATAFMSLAAMAGPALAADSAAAVVTPAAGSTATTQETRTVGSASKENIDRDEARIRQLHDQLKITAAQETLWTEVAQTMRSNDEKMDLLTTARHEKSATMSAVQDLRSYGEISEAHALGIKTFVPVFEKLYDSMSAAQKVDADSVFRAKGMKKGVKSP
jgi:hypothetical protein